MNSTTQKLPLSRATQMALRGTVIISRGTGIMSHASGIAYCATKEKLQVPRV